MSKRLSKVEEQKRHNIVFRLLNLVTFFILFSLNAQQNADTKIETKIVNPRFDNFKGSRIVIDQSHHNFHQMSGRFKPFSDLMISDGYQLDSIINLQELKTNDILVISNPINEKNIGNWRQPIYNAFSSDEIIYLKKWVKKGGKLLLIADHMPFSGAANELANAFGFDFCDGFAYINKENRNAPDVFSMNNKRLLNSVISDGTLGSQFDNVTTFTGSSFTIPKRAIGILKFLKGDYCLTPQIAWQFNDDTPSIDLVNSYQGAILNFGKGKIAVFGEAAMFTAQTITNNSGTFKFGFHSEQAPNNIEFIRNVLFWLHKD
ncbi:hypothetical protein SAMN05216503_0586 [Polaribacter sp. KT25b]|uniref:hypothetical protein n=1 Tax=Polaribacter sp. KT25b TaxID=1855336 RepID=UPI00087D145C|nr:hypothetical protein [Polaribacter sp. KT25b]SDR71793.1 hypothetical protein SAMN05216503_0586 [Polaribacter sp. KT25b]